MKQEAILIPPIRGGRTILHKRRVSYQENTLWTDSGPYSKKYGGSQGRDILS